MKMKTFVRASTTSNKPFVCGEVKLTGIWNSI